MHVLHLFFEGLIGLSTISFCICMCLVNSDNDTPRGRTQAAPVRMGAILHRIPTP
jgi:hypothetical protein